MASMAMLNNQRVMVEEWTINGQYNGEQGVLL